MKAPNESHSCILLFSVLYNIVLLYHNDLLTQIPPWNIEPIGLTGSCVSSRDISNLLTTILTYLLTTPPPCLIRLNELLTSIVTRVPCLLLVVTPVVISPVTSIQTPIMKHNVSIEHIRDSMIKGRYHNRPVWC